jgi:hypothetical protein
MKVVRFDQMPLRATRDENGFLVAPAAFTRVGVFYYVNDDGSVRAELRLAEEVFADATLQSMQMLPVTNDHPPEMVNPQNAKKYQVGFSSENVIRDADMAKGYIKVTDAAAINAIESGQKVELSCGYMADLDFTEGIWEGIRYDAIQRNIRYNHIAIVQNGRAGSQCKIKTDSADVRFAVSKPIEGSTRMKLIRVDGIEVELSDVAGQVVEKHLAHRDMTEKEIKDKLSELEEKKMDLEKELEKMKGNKDAMEAELAKAKDEAEAARKDANDMTRIDALVKARAELIDKCKPMVAADVKLDAMSDLEIKTAVVAATYPEIKLDGASSDRIDGLFEGAINSAKLVVERQKKVDEAMGAPAKAKGDDFDQLRKDARDAASKAWQTTLKADK